MKITKEKLKALIREELEKITEEENIYRTGKVQEFQQGFMDFQNDEEKLINHITSWSGDFMKEYAKSDSKWLNNMIQTLRSFEMEKAADHLAKQIPQFV